MLNVDGFAYKHLIFSISGLKLYRSFKVSVSPLGEYCLKRKQSFPFCFLTWSLVLVYVSIYMLLCRFARMDLGDWWYETFQMVVIVWRRTELLGVKSLGLTDYFTLDWFRNKMNWTSRLWRGKKMKLGFVFLVWASIKATITSQNIMPSQKQYSHRVF